MENNEFEETQDTATDAEQIETQEDGQEETIESLRGQVAKFKAIAERKDKKLQEKPKEIIKTNTEQGVPTLEHMAILSKPGATIEKVKYAEKVAQLEGKTLLEAYESDLSQTKFAQMDQEVTVKANALPASGGSAPAPREKTSGNMTDEEHRAWAEKKMRDAIRT